MAWDDIAREQAGAISRQQLRDHGRCDRSIARMLARGDLVGHAWGVFVVRGAPVTYATELWIAVLSTRGLIGFGTAAHLWGMDDRPPGIDIVIGSERRVARRFGVRLHHVFVPRSALTRREGLPMTTRAWSLMDHLSRLPSEPAHRMADRGLQRGWLHRADLARRLEDYPARRGNAILRELHIGTGDDAAALSERKLHALLKRAGLTDWVANYALWHNGDLVAVLDVAFVGPRIAIEVDGWAYHSDVDRFHRDRQRQNALVSLGWTVLRFTWRDVTQRPDYVIATIRAQR